MDEDLLVFCRLCQLATIAAPDVLTAGAQPYCLCFEILLLLVVEVAVLEIVKSPDIVVALFRASKIAQAQARLRPPHVFAVELLLNVSDDAAESSFWNKQLSASLVSSYLLQGFRPGSPSSFLLLYLSVAFPLSCRTSPLSSSLSFCCCCCC